MGTVILGKLESGSISKAQQLVMMPNRVSDSLDNKIKWAIRFSYFNINYVVSWCERSSLSDFHTSFFSYFPIGHFCLSLTLPPSATLAFACAAHGGGVKSPIRRCGNGRRRPRREPQVAAEGHRGGGDPTGLYPVQRREPLPLGAHVRRPGQCPMLEPNTPAESWNTVSNFGARNWIQHFTSTPASSGVLISMLGVLRLAKVSPWALWCACSTQNEMLWGATKKSDQSSLLAM